METIETIKDGKIPEDKLDLKVRKAARGIFTDENNLIPILFVDRYDYHKLPGGGIEDDESEEKALRREFKEETGSQINIEGEVGEIIEFRSEYNLYQTSHCYYGTINQKGDVEFSDSEKEDGFKLLWLSLEEAIEKIENDEPQYYDCEFIKKRALAFLRRYKEYEN